MPSPRRTARTAKPTGKAGLIRQVGTEPKASTTTQAESTPATIHLGLSDTGANVLRTVIESYIAEHGSVNLPGRDAAILAGILDDLPQAPPKRLSRRQPRRPGR